KRATLLPQLRARAELAKWKEQQTKDQESERSNWCPAKPKGTPSPEVYFAMEDETGHTEWMFCDGTRVVGLPGKAPEYVAPKEGRPATKGFQGVYLRNAAKYQQPLIRRAPKAAPAPAPAATTSASTSGQH